MKHLSTFFAGVFFILIISFTSQAQVISPIKGSNSLPLSPAVYFSPDTVVNYQWTQMLEPVTFTLGNSGQSVLNFEFPDYLDHSLKAPLSYCSATATNCDEYIGRVQIGTIDNLSNCDHYSNFTSVSTNLNLNESIPVTITNGGNAYSNDEVYIWIDYNQNGSFEATELTTLTSSTAGASFTGNITVPLTAVPGLTTMRIRMSYSTAADPCGTQSYGEVEDYAVNLVQLSFVTDVLPSAGTIPPGTTRDVIANFSSQGPAYSLPGIYYHNLVVSTNDPIHPTLIIPCKMVVLCPGLITGTVTDSLTGAPMTGALVMAGSYSTYTLGDGSYSLQVDFGINNLVISAIGYTSVTVPVMVPACETVQLDFSLVPAAYPPACASSVVDPLDYGTTTVWCTPDGPQELFYDDGIAENYTAWQLAGNKNAVKFTPQLYPVVVTGGEIYTGDGSYPVGGNFTGQGFGIAVYAADGPGGMPGSMLDSVFIIAQHTGWVSFTGLNTTISAGDFYLVMTQGSNAPDCVPLGIDATLPKAYKSYSRNVAMGEGWVISPYQDMMMRVIVTAPQGGDKQTGKNTAALQTRPFTEDNKLSKAASQAVDHYEVWRITGFDPLAGPQFGIPQLISTAVTGNTFSESGSAWANVPQGWVAYGIKAVYAAGTISAFTYSNPVPHKLFAQVTVNVTLSCGMTAAAGATVTLTGTDYPFNIYTATVSASGMAQISNVIQGNYQMQVTCPGYQVWEANELIDGDMTFNVVLQNFTYAPQNLQVDDLTLVASWDPPQSILLDENFEGSTFPPAGWQNSFAGSVGWYHTNSGHFGYYQVPQHTWYAMTNDGDAGTTNNGCCDRLITPALNLTNATAYKLTFDAWHLGDYGLIATVEISTDSCQTWTTVYTLTPSTAWRNMSIDLSAWSGPGGPGKVWLAFRSDDAGLWSTGWCVDNVKVYSDAVANQGYAVFLDGSFVGQTQLTQWTFNPTTINYGQTYVVGVSGIYCSGYGEQDTAVITSHFLYPPRNLSVKGLSTGSLVLNWDPPLPGDNPVIGSVNQQDNKNIPGQTGNQPASLQPGAMWDVLHTFPAITSSESAVTSDGYNIFTAEYNSPSFHKYSIDGNWISDFTINGAADIYDFASVNGSFYAVANTSDILKLDLQNQSLLGTISTGLNGLRHIAYDPSLDNGNGGFWVGGPGDENMVRMNGSLIQVVSAFNLTACSGAALDTVTAAGPYLWFSEQAGTGTEIYQFDISSMAFTGFVQDISTIPGYQSGGRVAGLELLPDVIGGHQVLLGAVLQTPGMVFMYDISTNVPNSCTCLAGYKIYRDGVFLAQVPPVPTTYWDVALDPGNYCYEVSAFYDLSSYGFPAQFGESVKAGPVCGSMRYGKLMPFYEDWTSATFTLNEWTASENWSVEGQAGNPSPSAKFSSEPFLTNYSSSLESYWMLNQMTDTTVLHRTWIDFDLKLDEQIASADEHLTIEIGVGDNWDSIADYQGNGTYNWNLQHLDITGLVDGNEFKFRFRAHGINSADIQAWYIDNIHVYYEFIFPPPQNLVVTVTGNPDNDMHLSWQLPSGAGSMITYQLDDNSAENAWAINPGYDGWMGNEFLTNGQGIMKYASIFWAQNQSTMDEALTLDIFDSTRTLVASTGTFIPSSDAWQTIALPDVPFSGTFYAMVHWNLLAGQTNYLGADEDGMNASANPGWYYDGVDWLHLSDFGYNPNVFLIRVKVHLETGDHKMLMPGGKKNPTVNKSAGTGKSLCQFRENHGKIAVPELLTNDNLNQASGVLGYNIYKQYYLDPLPGQYDTLSAWEYTGFTVDNEYTDMDLFNNCYTYRVTAVYAYGESVPSNESEQCISSNINEYPAESIRIYPNPASDVLYIDLTKDAAALAIYNSSGARVNRFDIRFGNPSILDVSDLEPGIYAIRFRMRDGSFETKRFVVFH